MPTIDFKDLLPNIKNRAENVKKALPAIAREVGMYVQREAKDNAPRSPTQAQIDLWRTVKQSDGSVKLLKRSPKDVRKLLKRRQKLRKTLVEKHAKQGKAWRQTRPAPGGLERSISNEVIISGDDVTANVFVASNSEAQGYAKKIHDEKGKSWHRRGRGTINKGDRADDKFIARAVHDAKTDAKTRRSIMEKLKRVTA